ncbi:unnamed protein product [Mytilus edulis]|uniref:Peptidase A2 domain-containing protein n=1 Tax=Mytilus edulis TaxID=6550 RepID=A0A8S3QIU8_MYTED|nr:unnamed protein product [Mytilus edulis]
MSNYVPMLIDTGANITILSKQIFDDWNPSCKPEIEPVKMNMLTATGEKSPFHGKVKLNIQIGRCSYEHEFLLAEIRDNGILGMDFLTKNKCDLMLGKGYMMLYKERIPCFSNYEDLTNIAKDHAVRILKKESITKVSLEKVTSNQAETELQDLSFDNGVIQQNRVKEKEWSSLSEGKGIFQVVSLEKPIYQESVDPFNNGLATDACPIKRVVHNKDTTSKLKIKRNMHIDIPVNVITRNMTKNRTEELPEELKGEITPEKLIQSQKEDSDIKVISDYKNINVKPGWQDISRHGNKVKSYWNQWDSLEFRNGILCRKYENIPGDEITWQIVLPKALKKVVMEQLHNNITSGHLGIKKTLARVTNRFYWYGLRSDVEHWCKTCDICASKKAPQRKAKAPMKQYNVGAPLERVAIDIMGPLPQTEKAQIHNGHRRLLYKVDPGDSN